MIFCGFSGGDLCGWSRPCAEAARLARPPE
nr:MAG TPA: hypothetical protein [Caudoviricetes sp.]